MDQFVGISNVFFFDFKIKAFCIWVVFVQGDLIVLLFVFDVFNDYFVGIVCQVWEYKFIIGICVSIVYWVFFFVQQNNRNIFYGFIVMDFDFIRL